MRAMVLAAGRSERLRPLTDTIAKPALPFCGEPVLGRVLDGLAAAGIEEVVVNVSHAPESVRAVIAARGRLAPAVSLSDETALLLGTAGALVPVRATFAGEASFLLVNGDCVHEIDYRALVAAHEATGASATLAARPTAEIGFGALRVDGEGRIEELGVRARGVPGERHFLSVQVVSAALLDFLPREPRPFSTFAEWYPAARAAGHSFRVHETDAPWHALDTPQRYLEATRRFVEARGGTAFVAAGASVAADATVGAGCAVHEGCVVAGGARLAGSVLLPGARVGAGARVQGSILGPAVHVPAGARVRDAVLVE
jgi:mannose-1-phosphate guanylyltransferase